MTGSPLGWAVRRSSSGAAGCLEAEARNSRRSRTFRRALTLESAQTVCLLVSASMRFCADRMASANRPSVASLAGEASVGVPPNAPATGCTITSSTS
jgi:hypothetical protein